MKGGLPFLCTELYYSYGGRNSIAMKVGMGGSPLSDATRGGNRCYAREHLQLREGTLAATRGSKSLFRRKRKAVSLTAKGRFTKATIYFYSILISLYPTH